MSTPETIPAFDIFLKDYVSQLPQAIHIQEENANKWYRDTVKIEPERFWWHYERLKGIGGSEMGEIVAGAEGKYNTFNSTQDIWEKKLMIQSIEPSTVHTRWGTKMEQPISEIFREDFGCERHEGLLDKADSHVNQDRSWLRNNLDDVVVMAGQGGKENVEMAWIIDYKNKSVIPSEPTDTEKAQVHQYRIALRESGYEGAIGMILVYGDHSNKCVVPKMCEYSPDLEKKMLKYGQEFWDHVLDGTKPPYVNKKKPVAQFSDSAKEQISDLEVRLGKMKMIANAAKAEAELMQKELKEIVATETAEIKIKDHKLPLQTLGTKVNESINEPELEHILETRGIDPDTVCKPGKKLDEVLVYEFIKEHGGNPQDFKEKVYDIKLVKDLCENLELLPPTKESLSTSFSAAKTRDITKEDVADVKEQCKEVLVNALMEIDLRPRQASSLGLVH